MPKYDYRCLKCEAEFEATHGMNESPIEKCPICGSEQTKRIPHSVGFSISKSTPVVNKAFDQVKRNMEMKEELRTKVGIEKISPIGNATMTQIYSDTMAQASKIKEDMAASREKQAKATSEKQREWTKKALLRTPERAKIRAEMKAKESAEKRAIRL